MACCLTEHKDNFNFFSTVELKVSPLSFMRERKKRMRAGNEINKK
jgi:hypothetical protein